MKDINYLQTSSSTINMKQVVVLFTSFVLLLFTLLAQSGTKSETKVSTISKVRAWTSPDKTRLVFELDKKAKYKAFLLTNPTRLSIDFEQTNIKGKVLDNLLSNSLIDKVRQSEKIISKNNKRLRVVFDLSSDMRKVNDFLLTPNKEYQYRLVVDLYKKPTIKKVQKAIHKNQLLTKTSNKVKTTTVAKAIPKTTQETSKQTSQQINQQTRKTVSELPKRKLIVAVDAGHGGEDPGATGRFGKKEKHIVFAIAKKLARKINSQPGMKAVLIRTGDYYVSLRKRTQKARKVKADIFISIHADAFRNAKAKGSSVFILSKRGASSESAKWLATKENSADLAGGVRLDDKDDLLVKVLLDLSQTATIEGSVSVASRILKGLKKIGKVHKKQVERAGFVVLKSPDIPSVLVETGFISNPEEERKLSTSSYQQKMANAIFNGINDYFKKYPIPGTIYGQKVSTIAKSPVKTGSHNRKTGRNHVHVVRAGDSLSRISKKYNISISALKRRNGLRSDKLYIGKKLKLL